MPEEVLIETPVLEDKVVASPFSTDNWKTAPTEKEVVADVVKEAAVEEKPIVEDKPVVEAEKVVVEEKPIVETAAIETPKFANEESEKVFNLIKEGKLDDAMSIYSEQQKLANANKLPPAEIIKLNLQYQNKDFTPTEIQDLFDENYPLPEKPVQAITEDDEDFKIREEKYEKDVQRVENRISRDAKPATAELLKLSKEIVFPDIIKESPVRTEPTQEELEGQKKAMELFFKDVEEGSKGFNGYNTTFKDEEVEIKVLYPVTAEDKKALTPLFESLYKDFPKFLSELGWTDADGKITPKVTEDLHLLQNRDKVFAKLVSEVGNQRLAEKIKSQKNIDYSGKTKSNGDLGATPQEKEKAMVTHFFSR